MAKVKENSKVKKYVVNWNKRMKIELLLDGEKIIEDSMEVEDFMDLDLKPILEVFTSMKRARDFDLNLAA